MGAFTERKWLSVTLLAVVLPISVLITFRLTGVLPEPPTPESFTAETVHWSMDKPSYNIFTSSHLQNIYREDNCYVCLRVIGFHYDPHHPPFGKDSIWLSVYANASVAEGFIESCDMYFYEEGNSSFLMIWQSEPPEVTLVNLKAVGTSYGPEMMQSSLKAYATTVGVKHPRDVYACREGIIWVLLDENSVNHRLEILLQVTYRTKLIYREVTLPIRINVYVDVGDTFEAAKAISSGVYNGSVHWVYDPDDYYAIQLDGGQSIQVQLTTPPQSADFDLYLYNPSKELRASSCTREPDAAEHITFTADTEGLWYIQVHSYNIQGVYALKIIESNGNGGHQ